MDELAKPSASSWARETTPCCRAAMRATRLSTFSEIPAKGARPPNPPPFTAVESPRSAPWPHGGGEPAVGALAARRLGPREAAPRRRRCVLVQLHALAGRLRRA